MKSDEAVIFDQNGYAEKISDQNYSYYELANNIFCKRRKLARIAPALLSAVESAVETAIASYRPGNILPLVVYFRDAELVKEKLISLELEWRRRGQPPLPDPPVQDTMIPVMLTSAKGAMGYAINVNLTDSTEYQRLSNHNRNKVLEGYPIGATYISVKDTTIDALQPKPQSGTVT